MVDQTDLLNILADGHFHSGQDLSNQLRVSRSAVWKAIKKFGDLGIDIQAIKGKGYRLTSAIELLNKEKILSYLDLSVSAELLTFEVHTQIDSTNKYLLDIAKSRPHGVHACIAEFQTSGRGRRGREWVSSFGQNITLSILKKVECSPVELGGLSLALGVSIASLLHEQGVYNIGVKWPNDILLNGQKLAGILIELLGESTGPSWVVMGIGLNMKLDHTTANAISQPWADLSTVIHNTNRNAMAGQILNTLLKSLAEFESQGLCSFHENWKKYDYYYGKPVTIIHGHKNTTGVLEGIDPSGALLLKKPNGDVQKHISGEVSLRPANTNCVKK